MLCVDQAQSQLQGDDCSQGDGERRKGPSDLINATPFPGQGTESPSSCSPWSQVCNLKKVR